METPENKDNHVCPNCRKILSNEDVFCPKCGQKRLDEKDFLVRKLIAKSFGDFFHFDSKFIHTLIPLLFKPGKLTVEFMQGRRAKYFQPFKMFLFISVFYFILAGFGLNHFNNNDQSKTNAVTINKLYSSINKKGDTIFLSEDSAKLINELIIKSPKFN
jgi:hypothetical protein